MQPGWPRARGNPMCVKNKVFCNRYYKWSVSPRHRCETGLRATQNACHHGRRRLLCAGPAILELYRFAFDLLLPLVNFLLTQGRPSRIL